MDIDFHGLRVIIPVPAAFIFNKIDYSNTWELFETNDAQWSRI